MFFIKDTFHVLFPVVVIDVSSKVNGDADYVLYKKDLEDIVNYKFEKPCVVVFKFGWSQYFNDPQKYLGLNNTDMRFPGNLNFNNNYSSPTLKKMNVTTEFNLTKSTISPFLSNYSKKKVKTEVILAAQKEEPQDSYPSSAYNSTLLGIGLSQATA